MRTEQNTLLDWMEDGAIPYVDGIVSQAKRLGLSYQATEEVIAEWLDTDPLRSFPWSTFDLLWPSVSPAQTPPAP